MQRLTREAQFIAEPFRLYLTEDFQEAARAFTEKRPPKGFKGR
jgi:enoyl-CoA hydratase/carnithine racemase